MGRKTVPAELNKIRGNPGKRHAPAGFKSQSDIGNPPTDMSNSQKKIWRAIRKAAPDGLLTFLDRGVMEVYVVAEDTYQQARRKLDTGLIVKSPIQGAPMQNPYLSIMNRQAELKLKAGSELGFSPSSRTRAGVSGGKPKGSRFGNNGVEYGKPKLVPG